jgi:Uma2 family endonuclease
MSGVALAQELPRTLEAFVAWAEDQPEDWEFVADEPIMIGVPPRRHTVIKGNIFRRLAERLEGTPFTVYVNGLELRAFGQSTRPDVLVSRVGGGAASLVEDEPVLIVEVGSPSSFDRDMGAKLERYRQYPSLQHYLVVHHAKRCVILHDRETADRLTQVWVESGTVALTALAVGLTLDEIFAGTVDEPEPPADA